MTLSRCKLTWNTIGVDVWLYILIKELYNLVENWTFWYQAGLSFPNPKTIGVDSWYLSEAITEEKFCPVKTNHIECKIVYFGGNLYILVENCTFWWKIVHFGGKLYIWENFFFFKHQVMSEWFVQVTNEILDKFISKMSYLAVIFFKVGKNDSKGLNYFVELSCQRWDRNIHTKICFTLIKSIVRSKYSQNCVLEL